MYQYSRAWSKGNDCYWSELGKNNQPPKSRNFPAGMISAAHIQLTTQQDVDEEDGEWEVSPSEYKKLCQRDDFRAIRKRMQSEDVIT